MFVLPNINLYFDSSYALLSIWNICEIFVNLRLCIWARTFWCLSKLNFRAQFPINNKAYANTWLGYWDWSWQWTNTVCHRGCAGEKIETWVQRVTGSFTDKQRHCWSKTDRFEETLFVLPHNICICTLKNKGSKSFFSQRCHRRNIFGSPRNLPVNSS